MKPNIPSWTFPEISNELQEKICSLQVYKCARCGEALEEEHTQFHFIIPPHCVHEDHARFADLISENNIVALCKNCYAQFGGGSTIISVKFVDDQKVIVDEAPAQALGNCLYRLLESPKQDQRAAKDDIVDVTLKNLPAKGVQELRFYVFLEKAKPELLEKYLSDKS